MRVALCVPACAVQPDPVQSGVVSRNALGGLQLGVKEMRDEDESKDCFPLL